MAISYGSAFSAVTDGLVLYYDALNPKSYSGQGVTWTNFIDGTYPLTKKPNSGSFPAPQGITFPQYNIGGWFSFTGGSGTVNYSRFDSDLVNGYTYMSLEVWWRVTSPVSTTTTQSPISAGGPTSNLYGWYGYGIRLDPTAKEVYYDYADGSGGNPAVSAINYSANHVIVADKWHHIISTWDYDTQTAKGYFDGIFKASASGSTASLKGITGHYMRVGVRADLQGSHFKGDIAIIKIYNRTLTANEVLQNYYALRGRFGV